MKRYIIEWLMLSFFMIICHLGYSQDWKVRAVSETGSFIDVKAIDANGDMYDVVARTKGGDGRFMDVKAKKDNSYLSVKLISSHDFYIPVKALNSEGEILAIKAVDKTGKKHDIKGISRSGSTIRIAAITDTEKYMTILAISPKGVARHVVGVKFQDEDVEMEIGTTEVIAHIKALPSSNIQTDEYIWNIRAIGSDGSNIKLVALGKKGEENAIKAISFGGNFNMMNVKAFIGKEKVNVKLINEKEGKMLMGIDYLGNKYPIKVKTEDGKYYNVHGGVPLGNTIDIKANGMNGVEYKIKAISQRGDVYDVLGIKLNHDDREEYITGLKESVTFDAHVKALPSIR